MITVGEVSRFDLRSKLTNLLDYDEEDAGSGRGTEQFTCKCLLLCILLSFC